MLLGIDKIRLDGDTQVRCTLIPEVVSDYASNIRNGIYDTPLIVYVDSDGNHWLADGFHRLEAHKRIGHTEVEVQLHHGDRIAAWLAGLDANRNHGQPMTLADKLRAVARMVEEPAFAEMSSREMARRCGVCVDTVTARRTRPREHHHLVSVDNRQMPKHELVKPIEKKKAPPRGMEPVEPVATAEAVVEVTRKGKKYKMDVSKIRKARKKPAEELRPYIGRTPINPSAKALLKGSTALKKTAEMNALAKLAPAIQVRVAELIGMGEFSTVKESVAALKDGSFGLTALQQANASVMHLKTSEELRQHIRFCEARLIELQPRQDGPRLKSL